MIIIFFFLTVIIVITYPIIGYKIFKAIQRKNKRQLKRLLGILTILILLPGFFWRILPGSDFLWRPIEKIQENKYHKELTGFEFHNGPLIYEYETRRDFNGDGYSIWIYELEEDASKYFKNPNTDFFVKYPKTNLRNDWQVEFWKKTPFQKNEQKFIDFAHSPLNTLEFELEDLLNEEGNYYGYEYYMHDFGDKTIFVGNIDFYIICPDRKLIVKINHNT